MDAKKKRGTQIDKKESRGLFGNVAEQRRALRKKQF